MPRRTTPLRTFHTRIFEAEQARCPTPPYFGAGWEGHLSPASDGLGQELTIHAGSRERAQRAAGVFYSVLDALNVIALTRDVAVVPMDGRDAEGSSPPLKLRSQRTCIAAESAALALKLAAVASRRLALVSALHCLRLSRRAWSPEDVTQSASEAPQGTALIQATTKAYSALEHLRLDVGYAERSNGPAKEEGMWNLHVLDALENRLRLEGIDQRGEVMWVTANGNKAEPAERSISLADAIYAASLLRDRAAADAVTADDVCNVQSLVRALLLGALGHGPLSSVTYLERHRPRIARACA